MKSFISILCLCFLTALPALGADFYVSTAGSDSNPGTQAQPFATIQHANDMCPVPPSSSTIHLDASTWNESTSLEAKSITLIGDYNGPHGMGGRTASVVNGNIGVNSYNDAIIFVKFLTTKKISINAYNPCTIDSCDITNSGTDGVVFMVESPSGQAEITNCLIANCGTNGIRSMDESGNIGANINNCTIHDCHDDGINIIDAGSTINNNNIYNCGNGIFNYDFIPGSLIYNNNMHDNLYGIFLQNDRSKIYNTTIQDNLIYSVYIASVGCNPDLGGGSQSSAGNNTISGNGTYEVYNDCPNNIYAKNNNWDSQSEGEMAGGYYDTVNVTRIWDKWEDTSKGYIMWSDPYPIKTAAPSLGMLKATFYPSSNTVGKAKKR